MSELKITGLKKSFSSNFLISKKRVLNGVNLEIAKGKIYGFLGANGAGKTTTIKCILGLVKPDEGEIFFEGRKELSLNIREKIGFLPENPYYYDYLTVEELLRFFGKLFLIKREVLEKRIKDIIELVGLKGREKIKLKEYSKGMLQRAGVGQALINDPSFLILDEPFSGLDPVGRKELRNLITSLKEEGKTIFFSSHILQDMELIVDRFGILHEGVIRREGDLSEVHQILSSSAGEATLENLFLKEIGAE